MGSGAELWKTIVAQFMGIQEAEFQEPNRVRMKLRPNVAWCGG